MTTIDPPLPAPVRPGNGPGRADAPADVILVTGGAGFIGSALVRYLYDAYPDLKIRVLDKLTYAGDLERLPAELRESPRFEFVYGDVCNGALVTDAMSGVDTVVHLAAETHVTRSIYDSRTFFETDVLGTATLSDAAVKHDVRRFVHISTSEVYGTAFEGGSMSEEHPLDPCSPYASAKAGADRLVYSYWRTYGMPAVIVRPFNNYGPFQHLEKAVPRFVTSAILGEELTVHGDGSSSRDWLFVDDTCAGIDALLRAPIGAVAGRAFNLGTQQATDIMTLAKTVLDLTGRSHDLIRTVGDRPGQVELHRANTAAVSTLTGWAPQVQLADGLARTVEWYRANEAFWRKQMWMRRVKIATAAGREWH